MSFIILVPALIVLMLFLLLGVRIVRPTHRGRIERFGTYQRFAMPGLHWIIPFVDRMIQVNMAEQMMDAQPPEIIPPANKVAALDFANAIERQAEGIAQAKILAAEEKAEATRLMNETANAYLTNMEKEFRHNVKILFPADLERVNIIGEPAGILPSQQECREAMWV